MNVPALERIASAAAAGAEANGGDVHIVYVSCKQGVLRALEGTQDIHDEFLHLFDTTSAGRSGLAAMAAWLNTLLP